MGSRSSRASTSHALAWVLIIIAGTGSFVAAYTYTNGFNNFKLGVTGPGYTNPATVTGVPAGSAACTTDGLVHSVTSPGPCYNTSQLVQVHLSDVYAGSSLSGYSCTFFILQNGVWTFQESVLNTGTNGNCVTANSYAPGTPMYVWVCKDTSACSSTDYAQQTTTFFAPLPPPNGLSVGAGTVALANVPATSTPTEYTSLPIIKLAGDKAASNTPFQIKLQAPNGTAIINQPSINNAGTVTCFINQASGTNPCYLGSSQDVLTFTVTYSISFVSSTFPYGLGYASFSPVNQPAKGILSTGITGEIKQTVGSGWAIANVLGSTFTKNGQFLSSTDALYYTTPSDTSITKVVGPDGTTTNVGSSTQSITINVASQRASGASGDKQTITFNFYAYFSVQYYTANGAINSEAVTQATQIVLTLQRP